ncbi:MAG: hypothetical protein HQK63_07590 [Desulfamplus sp.]|nr:hypothetical protein [Desulfamplus sp.]
MFIKKIIFNAICVIFIGVFAGNAFAEETWKIASLDWQPYSGSDMSTQGNSIQKLRELLKKEGITLLVDFFPWLRSKHNAKKEQYIGYFPAWPEEVDEGFIASKPVDWSEISLLKQGGTDIAFSDIDTLFKTYKVGIVGSYVYPKEIEDAMKKYPHHADKAPDEISLLKKLSGGRHLVAITDPNVMLYLATKEGIFNVELMKGISLKKELVIALRNDEENKKRIELLERILKDVKE